MEWPLIDEALGLAREIGEHALVSQCLSLIAQATLQHGRYCDARRVAHEALTTAHDAWLAVSNALIVLARSEREQGELAAAQLHLERCLTMHDGIRDDGVDQVLLELGSVAWEQGDLASARSHYASGLEASRLRHGHCGAAMALAGQAELAAAVGESPMALKLIEETARHARRASMSQ